MEEEWEGAKKPHLGMVSWWGSCIYKAIELDWKAGWKTQTVIVLTSKAQ